MPHECELQAALSAAQAAGSVILEHAASFAAIVDPPISISTAADRAAQSTILRYLHAAFPADGLVAEEATEELSAAPVNRERWWIVDPIDGTRGFATKNGEYAVMIAFATPAGIHVGVVLEPATDTCTYATQGGGCWLTRGGSEPMRVRVTATPTLALALLTQSHSKGGAVSEPVRKLRPARVRETYSAGLKMALVARGEADLYANSYEAFHDWDIAAGQVLVEEAGGTVTTLAGTPIVYGTPGAWQRGGLLASNGLLHAAAVSGLAGT